MNFYGADLNLLFVFDALMAERNVTRAAAKIGRSQPALSNALGRLRRQLHDPLFVRAGKAMVPTPRALELAPEIDAALRHVRRATGAPAFRPGESRRMVRLATRDEGEQALFPALSLNPVRRGFDRSDRHAAEFGCGRVRTAPADSAFPLPDPDPFARGQSGLARSNQRGLIPRLVSESRRRGGPGRPPASEPGPIGCPTLIFTGLLLFVLPRAHPTYNCASCR